MKIARLRAAKILQASPTKQCLLYMRISCYSVRYSVIVITSNLVAKQGKLEFLVFSS